MKDASPEMMSLFHGALERVSAEERAAYLDAACGQDAELRERIEGLLRAHEQAGGFLQERSATTVSLDTVDHRADRDQPGVVLAGRYKLLETIGEGGMGTVWMAQQTEPVKRLVAVKLIKAGLDTKHVLARFEAERQALALMDHPNIAKVHDAGTISDARPFFVMELVKGVSITKYCDDQRLTLRRRLELFVPVCQAIQHAHQKGIIHRDIKPSNVLVTMYDDKPVPKVIDFGVAKATGAQLVEQTLYTGFGTVVGTVEYMSPEQASTNPLDVDTRSDIYSLGVLLYELLAGSPPFTRKDVEKAGLLEMLRVIREQEPARPSTKLSTGDRLAVLAANRGTEPARLAPLVRGELDWIVMKALEKDRSRRYETANAFAADAQRYLADEPVLACPPSAWYRARKFARRHKGPVLAAALVVLTLVGGITGTTIGLVQAESARQAEVNRANKEEQAKIKAEKAEANEREQRKLAAAARDRAVEEKQIAEAVRAFLQYRLLQQADATRQADSLLDAGESLAGAKENPTVRELLDRAAKGLTPEKIEKQFPGQPLVQAEILRTVGDSYRGVGEYKNAIAHLARARDLYRKYRGEDHPDTLDTLYVLAVAYWEAQQLPQAIEVLEQVRDRRVELLGPDHPNTLHALNLLAVVYRHAGRLPEAIRLFEQVRDTQIRKLGSDDPDILLTLHNLALAYQETEKLPEAIRLLEHVRERYLDQPGPDHPRTLTALHNLGVAYRMAGRLPEAIRLFEQVRDKRSEKLGPDHPHTLHTLYDLALTYQAAGKLPEAIRQLEEVRDKQLEKIGADHPDTLTTQIHLASAYLAAGKSSQAVRLFEEVRERRLKRFGPDHLATLNAMRSLAVGYHAIGKNPEAIRLLEQLREKLSEQLDRDDPRTLDALEDLARAYQEVGKLPEAIGLFEQVVDRYSKKFGPGHARTLNALRGLAMAYRNAEKLREAISLLEEAQKRRIDILGPDNPTTLLVLNDLAAAYYAAHRLDLSIPLFEKVLEKQKAVLGPDDPEMIRTMGSLAVNYYIANRPKDAVPLMEDALARVRKLPAPQAATLDWLPHEMAILYDGARMFAKSEPLYREFVETARKQFGNDHAQTANALVKLGKNLFQQRKPAEAEPVLRECLAIREKQRPDTWAAIEAHAMLTDTLQAQKKYAEAETLLLQNYEAAKRRVGKLAPRANSDDLGEASLRLVFLYNAWGKKDEEAKWQKIVDAHEATRKQAEKLKDK